ncbi:MAG: amidase [Nocardiopsaceae bacterium]|nr:amidase [Nocardiopsaceae bacterium]
MGRTPETLTGPFTGRTITDLAGDLRTGRVTSSGLVERALASATEAGTALGAFVTVDAAGARAAADQRDAERASGRVRGPLHGVPVAVKDNIDVAGLPTTAGSAHLRGNVPEKDAECVRRLREAGAVILGKTTTHEFAYGPTGDRSANGAARNPHDPSRMAGGSSGGSAAAVAAGIIPLALGTDTGGSVRIPAALCGVAGFKPAHGMIPTEGVFPLSTSLDVVGVVGRTALDCRIAAETIGGMESADTASRVPQRIGWLATGSLFAVDREVGQSARSALGTGETVDAVVDDAELTDLEALHEVFLAIQSSEAYAVHADRVEQAPELFDPEVLERLRAAAEVPGWRYVRALTARAQARRTVARLLDGYDLLALPTVPLTAPPIGHRTAEINGAAVGVRPALLALTSPWNVLDLPALTVPVGRVGGMPVSIQLVTAAGREHQLFRVAARLCSTTSTTPRLHRRMRSGS